MKGASMSSTTEKTYHVIRSADGSIACNIHNKTDEQAAQEAKDWISKRKNPIHHPYTLHRVQEVRTEDQVSLEGMVLL
jgi:hypothetical protein